LAAPSSRSRSPSGPTTRIHIRCAGYEHEACRATEETCLTSKDRTADTPRLSNDGSTRGMCLTNVGSWS
jgi:hypothetical protein